MDNTYQPFTFGLKRWQYAILVIGLTASACVWQGSGMGEFLPAERNLSAGENRRLAFCRLEHSYHVVQCILRVSGTERIHRRHP